MKDKILLYVYAILAVLTYIHLIVWSYTGYIQYTSHTRALIASFGIACLNYVFQVLFWRKYLSSRK